MFIFLCCDREISGKGAGAQRKTRKGEHSHIIPLTSWRDSANIASYARFLILFAVFGGMCWCQVTQPTVAAVQSGGNGASAEARYYRMICLVPMTGTGKRNDPVRPEFVPAAGAAASRDGILAWSAQMTDDRKMAIVHLVATNKKAFDALVNDKRLDIRVFEVGKHGKDTIETELKKYKKDFSLEKFRVVAR